MVSPTLAPCVGETERTRPAHACMIRFLKKNSLFRQTVLVGPITHRPSRVPSWRPDRFRYQLDRRPCGLCDDAVFSVEADAPLTPPALLMDPLRPSTFSTPASSSTAIIPHLLAAAERAERLRRQTQDASAVRGRDSRRQHGHALSMRSRMRDRTRSPPQPRPSSQSQAPCGDSSYSPRGNFSPATSSVQVLSAAMVTPMVIRW